MSAAFELRIGSPAALRRVQSQQELLRLTLELQAWREHRIAEDSRGQHKTQLAAIVGEVSAALAMVRQRLGDLGAAGMQPGESYTRLARIDRQIIWIRYAWDFFRSRFDQRDDPRLGQALRAADEVSWSCFKPFFQGNNQARPTAPLAYIDLDYSPSTLLSSHAHRLNRLDRVDNHALKGFFLQLPVPLLGLPPIIVTSPWMMALIAHESGHSIMNAADSTGGEFADRVTEAALRAGGADSDQIRWRAWSPEIFADWYSLLMMGSAAAWSLAQLEFGGATQMAAEREKYPPAHIRLLMLARMAAQLGLRDADALFGSFGIDAAQLAATAASGIDGKIAEEVAQLVQRNGGTHAAEFAEQVGFRRSDFQSDPGEAPAPVDKWALVLLGKIVRPVENDLRTARLVAAGAVRAAQQIQTGDDARIESDLEGLRNETHRWITDSCERGTRTATLKDRTTSDTLARMLLDIPDEELFGRAEPAP